MKTIFYFLFACFIYATTSFTVPRGSRNIILQPAGSSVSQESLGQAADVIRNRLQTYELESSVALVPGKSQIIVRIPENTEISDIQDLLTAEGNTGFYEILTPGELPGHSQSENKPAPSDGRLGCSSYGDIHLTDSLQSVLRSANLSSEYKLVWNSGKGKPLACLYAVKAAPAMTKADIGNISSARDSVSGAIRIDIRFRQGSVKTWAGLTGRSLNKPVAILIDNNVFYTPVVKTAMENGLCEITGSFTRKDVNFFLAFVKNDPLKVELKIK